MNNARGMRENEKVESSIETRNLYVVASTRSLSAAEQTCNCPTALRQQIAHREQTPHTARPKGLRINKKTCKVCKLQRLLHDRIIMDRHGRPQGQTVVQAWFSPPMMCLWSGPIHNCHPLSSGLFYILTYRRRLLLKQWFSPTF